MTVILLTNPDVVLYRGDDPDKIKSEIEAYKHFVKHGLIPKTREM